ncbi:MAG: hypothetical protein AAF908_02830 [Pseudomonadota bacterium]
MRTFVGLVKLLLILGLLGLAGLSVYALLSDLPAPVEEREVELPLPGGG